MVDTMRTLTDLGTRLGDNTTGAISPQDLRDALLATIQPGYSEMYISASTATTLGDTSTWVQVAGTYTLGSPSTHWSMGTNGRLQYDGAQDRVCMVQATMSATADSNNQQVEFTIGKNGTAVAGSDVQDLHGTGSDVVALATHAYITVSNGDYISALVRNTTSASNVTAAKASVMVMDLAK